MVLCSLFDECLNFMWVWFFFGMKSTVVVLAYIIIYYHITRVVCSVVQMIRLFAANRPYPEICFRELFTYMSSWESISIHQQQKIIDIQRTVLIVVQVLGKIWNWSHCILQLIFYWVYKPFNYLMLEDCYLFVVQA